MAFIGQKSRNPVPEAEKEPLTNGGHLSKRPFDHLTWICKRELTVTTIDTITAIDIV
jgi:hypothetical protein